MTNVIPPITTNIEPTTRGFNIVVNADSYGQFSGVVDRFDDPDTIIAGWLEVDPLFRGMGIGEKLVRRLAEEAKKRRIQHLESVITSQYSLDIRARLFGKEALNFYYDPPGIPTTPFPPAGMPLPITFDQARMSLVRAEAFEKDPDDRLHGFMTTVNLADLKPEAKTES